MFNVNDDAIVKEPVGNNRSKKNNLASTQPISSQGLQEGNKLLSNSRGGAGNGQQPGSRRELPNEKVAIQGTGTQNTRPGTAPQNLNGMLSSNSQSKQNRPMSPFTKAYNNNSATAASSGASQQR